MIAEFYRGCSFCCAFNGQALCPERCFECSGPEINRQGWIFSLGKYYSRCLPEHSISAWSRAVVLAKRHCLPVISSFGRILAWYISRYLSDLGSCLVTNVPGFSAGSEGCLFPRAEVCTTQILLSAVAKNLQGDGWRCEEGLLTQVGRKSVRQHCCKSDSRRRWNVSHIYAVPDPQRVAGKTIILLDDITTSGSTLKECANVLCDAGVANVVALTLARTVRRILQGGGQ